MNTAQLKFVSWGAAAVLGAGLGTYLYVCVTQPLPTVSREKMSTMLGNVKDVQQKAEDIVAYPEVQAVLIKLDWTGRKKSEPAPVVEVPKEPETTKLPVRAILKVLLVKADPSDDEGSRCVLKYTAAAKVSLKDPTVIKHLGDRLDAPNTHVRIAAIGEAGVEFAFDDEAREHETLLPEEMSLAGRVASTDPGTSPILLPGSTIPRVANYGAVPPKTVKIAPNMYVVGQEDADYWEANWDAELARMQYQSHRNPATGKYDGIEIRQVPEGSMAAAHGAKEGDIVKSINGHPVNSVNEAINFAKNNAHVYDVWEIEVENHGQTRIVTYKTPKKKK